jgi:hypothetical protein
MIVRALLRSFFPELTTSPSWLFDRLLYLNFRKVPLLAENGFFSTPFSCPFLKPPQIGALQGCPI